MPWYANGTLDADETAAVEAHLEGCDECRAELESERALGAMIATCTGRLIVVGLVDLRGALHLGVDEASWISSCFNAALMFIGPFSVYLGGLLGARRVLLACACIFTIISANTSANSSKST